MRIGRTTDNDWRMPWTEEPGRLWSIKNSVGDMLTVIVNTKNEAATVKVPLDFVGAEVTDLMTGKTVVPTASMDMEPYGYFLFRK